MPDNNPECLSGIAANTKRPSARLSAWLLGLLVVVDVLLIAVALAGHHSLCAWYLRTESQVPMVSVSNPALANPIVSAWFGDIPARNVMIDTGFDSCELSERLVKRLGLLSLDREKRVSNYDDVTVPSITIGTVRVDSVDCIVMPDRELMYHGVQLDGLLGTAFLDRVAVRLDFPHRMVTVWSSGGLTGFETSRLGFSGSTYVHFGGPLPTLHVRLNGMPVMGVLDTGSDQPVAIAERHGNLVDTRGGRRVRMAAFRIKFTSRVGTVHHLDVERMGSFEHVPAIVLPRLNADDADVYLGIGLLPRCDLILDARVGALYLRTP